MFPSLDADLIRTLDASGQGLPSGKTLGITGSYGGAKETWGYMGYNCRLALNDTAIFYGTLLVGVIRTF